MEAGSRLSMYKPPAMFPRPITEPMIAVVRSGAAESDRKSTIRPPATKNE